MAVFDTEENERSDYTDQTLISLRETVDFTKHKLVVADNGSCDLTKRVLKRYQFITDNFTIITLSENVGTAKAVNFGLKLRIPGETAIKIDNDVVIHQSGWVDEMEETIRRAPEYGIIGLKRKDLRQTPYDPDPNYKSELIQLLHQPGETWITVEETNDIMGTCTMFSSALLDKIGGMVQSGIYGFDDQLMALRSRLAGFKNCFLPHINIDHIDTGLNSYSQEKIRLANEAWPEYHKLHLSYCDGSRGLYEEL